MKYIVCVCVCECVCVCVWGGGGGYSIYNKNLETNIPQKYKAAHLF